MKGMPVLSAARQRGPSSGLGAVTKGTPLRIVTWYPCCSHCAWSPGIPTCNHLGDQACPHGAIKRARMRRSGVPA
eukprot:364349-Chlamydomonas_euryale.AAC.4